jgi:hypothetical protein
MRVWFRNKCPFPFSVHPHGVFYAKSGEGAPYVDNTADIRRERGDDNVYQGETWPFTWFVPGVAGPGPADPSSLVWLYHGHVVESVDEDTGLIGVIVVTARGKALVPRSPTEAKLRPSDVDREFVILAKVFNEENAGSLGMHQASLGGQPTPAAGANMGEFYSFSALNGLVSCSLALNAVQGERVRIYFVSLGNEIDMHRLAVLGHSMLFRGERSTGITLQASPRCGGCCCMGSSIATLVRAA